jgi:hypothetical protein
MGAGKDTLTAAATRRSVSVCGGRTSLAAALLARLALLPLLLLLLLLAPV